MSTPKAESSPVSRETVQVLVSSPRYKWLWTKLASVE